MQYLSLKLPHAFDICIQSNTEALRVATKHQPDAIVDEVDLSTALKRAEKEPVVLLAPGSQAVMMTAAVGAHTADKLRETIARGSGYLGFCGGAFAASETAHVYIRGSKGEERHQFPMMGLIEGLKSHGPAFPQYTGYSIAETGIQQVWSKTSYGRRVKCGWNQGPCFAPGPVSVVAEFEGDTRYGAAAVHGTRGKGNIVASGIHPEMQSWGETHEEKVDREELFEDMLERVTPKP